MWSKQMASAVLGSALLGGLTGCHAQQPWPLWKSYTAKFVDGQGRVIDHSAGDRTTSEGEAYAMLFALADNDQPRFAKLLQWTETNLAQGDLTLHLPAWNWGHAPDGAWRVLDPNPASDADLWMAYSLCEAGRLWHIDRYEKLGSTMANRIAKEELALAPGIGTTLLPSSVGFHPAKDTLYLNPSYLPPQVLEYFARQSPGSPFRGVGMTLPAMLRGTGGFAMDWVRVGPDGLHASGKPDSQDAGAGSYDAIRIYLWLGMADEKTPGVHESLGLLNGMSDYLKKNTTPPESVDGAGKVTSPNAPPGFSAAVLPFLHALNLTEEEKAQADRLAATHDGATGLYGKAASYYDQNLAMFATGWQEGRIRFESDGRLKTKWKP